MREALILITQGHTSRLPARQAVFLYGFLSLMAICLMGPAIWFGHHTASFLTLLLLLSALYVLATSHRILMGLPYMQMALFYAGLILAAAAMHEVALLRVPGGLLVNIVGQTAAYWSKANAVIALKYLMFPIFLAVQVVMLARFEFRIAGRIIIGFMMLSTMVQFYQALGDPSFLNPRIAPGKGGLATDMNAFGLVNFLSFGLLLSLCLLETVKWIRVTGILLIPAFVAATYFCGSRAAFGAVLLLVLLLPASYAMANRTRSVSFRLGIALLPLLLAGAAGLLLLNDYGTGSMASWGSVGSKLVSTWQAAAHNGVAGAFDHEVRGLLMSVGVALFKAAPWAGWGPGGFYREASNLVYQHTGMRVDQWDSAANHYLMILGDFGLPVLLLNMLLILVPMGFVVAALPKLESFRVRWSMAILFITNLVFLVCIFVQPPSYYFGPLWVWTVLLAAMFTVAGQHGVGIRRPRLSYAGRILLAVLFLSFLGAAWRVSFGPDGYAARAHYAWWSNAQEAGCLPSRFEDGYRVRLCGPDAIVERAYENDGPDTVVFSIRLQGDGGHQAVLAYGQPHAPMRTATIQTGAWTRIEIPIAHGDARERAIYQWHENAYKFRFHLEGKDPSGKAGIELRLPKGDHYRTHYIVGIGMWKVH